MRASVIAPKDEVENDEGYYDAEDTRQGKIKPVLHHQEGEQAFKHLVETWSVPPRDQPKTPLAVVTLKSRDNFNSEYMYDVSVKNLSSDPLVAESLIIVLDKITNIGSDERTSGTSESNQSGMEIPGQDGETDDGKPYFRTPSGSGPDLTPYTESSPVTVRIRNKDSLIVFTPFFGCMG
jgi:hypothetical protein